MTGRFSVILGSVAATAGLIALLQRWLGFPLLILFAIPIAASLRLGGLGPALATAASAAVIGDYFFVQPIGEVTVHTHGLRLLVFLSAGTWFLWFVVRPRAS